MSGPLLELRGWHMVVFQVKVLQVTFVRQHIGNVSELLLSCCVFLGSLLCVVELVSNAIRAPARACVFACAVVVVVVTDCGN